MKINTIVVEVEVRVGFGNEWRVSLDRTTAETGVEEIRIRLEADAPAVLPETTLLWSVPQLDMQTRWTPSCGFNRNIPPDWGGPLSSNLASSAPVMAFLNLKGQNRMTIARGVTVRRSQ